jgi:hypothetical protein
MGPTRLKGETMEFTKSCYWIKASVNGSTDLLSRRLSLEQLGTVFSQAIQNVVEHTLLSTLSLDKIKRLLDVPIRHARI